MKVAEPDELDRLVALAETVSLEASHLALTDRKVAELLE